MNRGRVFLIVVTLFLVVCSYARPYSECGIEVNISDEDKLSRLMEQGRNYENKCDYSKALRCYAQVIRTNPRYSAAYHRRAAVYVKLKKQLDASFDVVRILELREENETALLKEFAASAYDDIKERLIFKARNNPGQSEWPYYLGVLSEIRRHYKDAINYYKRAVSLSPDISIDIKIAQCYDRLMDWDEAVAYMDSVIERNPENYGNILLRAEYKYKSGDYRGVIEDIGNCIEAHPDLALFYEQRSYFELSMGLDDDAFDDIQKAIELNTGTAMSYVRRGWIYQTRGQEEKASDDFIKAIELDKNKRNTSLAIAYSYAYMGMKEKAAEQIGRILGKKFPATMNPGGVYYEAACVLSLIGDIDAGMYCFTKALDYGQNNFFHYLKDRNIDNLRADDLFNKAMCERWPDSLQEYNIYGPKTHYDEFVAPKFEGQEASRFSKWVNQRLVYPVAAKNARIQGKVILGFWIEEDGSMTDLKVILSPDKDLSEEALRVASQSPKWTPATIDRKPSRYHYYFPVIFQLR